MKNWTDHGVVFSVPADAAWAHDSWAPQPIERDGTIYMYFGNNANGVGVASSKDPIAGFKDAGGKALVDGSTPGAAGTDIWLFDPGALIDSDGQAYLAFGGNGENNARIIKLGSDLVSVNGTAAQLSPKGFFEASFMFKRNDTYYLAYSTNSDNGLRIDYLTSKSPMSGYTYGGVIADQPPQNGNNNHASEFVFKDKWYHAYHNRVVGKQAGIDATYRRNLALEVLDFNADGSIKEVTYTTDGVPQVGTLNPYARVEAETMNAQSGIETEKCAEGGMNVTEIGDGDWIKLRGLDFGTSGAKAFSARVASAAGGGHIELHLDSEAGMVVGKCEVQATGAAQTWATTTCDVSGATGVHDLVLELSGPAFNLNYWQFTPVDASMGGTGGAGGTDGAGGTSGGEIGGSGSPVDQAGSTSGGATTGGSASGSGPVGTAGSGGQSTGVGGQLSAAGTAAAQSGSPAANPDGASDSSGCGCAVPVRSPASAGLFGLVAATALALRRRRRQR
jgi:arabinoxylan arabinofuranohydrolase